MLNSGNYWGEILKVELEFLEQEKNLNLKQVSHMLSTILCV